MTARPDAPNPPETAAGQSLGAMPCSLSSRDHACFKAAHVEWGTPPDLYAALDAEFGFTLDPCKPGQVWDGTAIRWDGQRVYCNPPYGRTIGDWLAKGPEADVAVFLLPARTDTRWFHEHALKADEIRFFKGRLRFNEGHVSPADYTKRFKDIQAAPFPSMLVIFSKANVETLATASNKR
jgi:hypothetical protein